MTEQGVSVAGFGVLKIRFFIIIIINNIRNIILLLFNTADTKYDRESVAWKALLRNAMLCNRAEFKQGQDEVAVIKRWVIRQTSIFFFLKKTNIFYCF